MHQISAFNSTIDVPSNLRNQSQCNRSIPCTERYGIETASSVGPKLWDKFPTEIKNFKSLEEFEVRIKHVGYL